eukprot:GHRR01001611.1.p1 GENE.GHRR01001611.1~~GHRR01001611.1.p1  ORF type:complete len:446 (+),score=123.10 GHRR01001611.1:244-1581(+)
MQLHCNGATPWAVQSQFRKARSLARAETRGRLAHSTPSATSIATQSVGTAVTHTILPAPKDAHFTENRTVFAEEFRIRGNEAGPDQRANIITIANLLQEIGGNHGVAMWGRASSGFAAMPGMDHLIFVATRMQIRMEAYPNWGDIVRLETYFAEDGRLTTRRDWIITDALTGRYLGAATSTWVTINTDTRKLAKIPEDVRQKFLQFAPSPPKAALAPGDTRKKLPDFVWPAQLEGPSQLGRRGDMDPNGHINNVAYLSWALEVIPQHVYDGYHLTQVEMDFKAECTAGDKIECFGMSLTESQNGSSQQPQQYLHLLRKAGTGTEVWRARTTWSPRQQSANAGGNARIVVVKPESNSLSVPLLRQTYGASNGKSSSASSNGHSGASSYGKASSTSSSGYSPVGDSRASSAGSNGKVSSDANNGHSLDVQGQVPPIRIVVNVVPRRS